MVSRKVLYLLHNIKTIYIMTTQQWISKIEKVGKKKVDNTCSTKVLEATIVKDYSAKSNGFKNFKKYHKLNPNGVVRWCICKNEKKKYVVCLYQPKNEKRKVQTYYAKVK